MHSKKHMTSSNLIGGVYVRRDQFIEDIKEFTKDDSGLGLEKIYSAHRTAEKHRESR